jgi:hypothetical protein
MFRPILNLPSNLEAMLGLLVVVPLQVRHMRWECWHDWLIGKRLILSDSHIMLR